jgi:cell division protein FtsL
MMRLSMVMLAAVVASAMVLVHSQYETRRLFVEHEKALKEAARLDMELERLTVERRAQATPLRVEQIARQQLQMRNPPPGITQYVAAPGAGLATAGAAQGAKP